MWSAVLCSCSILWGSSCRSTVVVELWSPCAWCVALFIMWAKCLPMPSLMLLLPAAVWLHSSLSSSFFFSEQNEPLALPCLFRSLLCCATLTIIKDWGDVDLSTSLTFYCRWLFRLIILMRIVITVEKSNDRESFELRITKIMFCHVIVAWVLWLTVPSAMMR